MVNPGNLPAAGLQSINQVPPSIDIEARDNIQEERIYSTGNQRNKDYFAIGVFRTQVSQFVIFRASMR